MGSPDHHLEILLALEASHDDLLARLDDLNQRVEKVLAECAPARKNDAAAASPGVESQ